MIATIATLAALLLPALNTTKVKAHQANCLSNLRQLGIAWTMYKDDNNDLLAESYCLNNPSAWVQGDMSVAAQATNLSLIQSGKLFDYNKDVHLYRCPTDAGATTSGSRVASVRSYSMNSFMGCRDPQLGPIPNTPTASAYVPFFTRHTQLPTPAKLFVFIDKDEQSIHDGFFVSDPGEPVWYNFPSVSRNRHLYSASWTFADGHALVFQFRDPRTAQVSVQQTDQSGNPDLAKLAEAATVRR